MGCGPSNKVEAMPFEAKKTLAIVPEAEKEDKIKKILLLGVAGSGKSTFFKQIKDLHGGGFSKEERSSVHLLILNNMIKVVAIIIDKSTIEINKLIEKHHEIISNLPSITRENMTENNFGESLKILWDLKEIKEGLRMIMSNPPANINIFDFTWASYFSS